MLSSSFSISKSCHSFLVALSFFSILPIFSFFIPRLNYLKISVSSIYLLAEMCLSLNYLYKWYQQSGTVLTHILTDGLRDRLPSFSFLTSKHPLPEQISAISHCPEPTKWQRTNIRGLFLVWDFCLFVYYMVECYLFLKANSQSLAQNSVESSGNNFCGQCPHYHFECRRECLKHIEGGKSSPFHLRLRNIQRENLKYWV